MSKGQKRTSKEPKKLKSAENKARKLSGPKYLRQSERPAFGAIGAQKIGQKP